MQAAAAVERTSQTERNHMVRGLGRMRRHLKMIALNKQKRSNSTIEMIAPMRHNKRTGLWPIWLERWFQWSTVITSKAKCREIHEDYPLQRFLTKHG